MIDILVLASGNKTGGGSGMRHFAENCVTGVVNGRIVAVASQHNIGGVRKHTGEMGLPFFHLTSPFDAAAYRMLIHQFKPKLVVLLGWLKFVVGIEGIPIINIHPGRLPDTAGLHGIQVHERAIELASVNRSYTTAVSMHLVPYQEEVDRSDYDTGPVFFEYPLVVRHDDTPETLQSRVNEYEHGLHSFIINMIATGDIRFNLGTNEVIVPPDYPFLPRQR